MARKMLADDFVQLKKLYKSGISRKEIAERLGLKKQTLDSQIEKCLARGYFKKRKTSIQKIGENHNVAKLTEKEVINIIEKYLATGSTFEAFSLVSEKVKIEHVRAILCGSTWKHIYIRYAEKIKIEKASKVRRGPKAAKKVNTEYIHYPSHE